MHAHSQTHQPHTRPSPPEGPPGTDCVFQKAPRGPGRRGGHRACPEATLPSGVPHPGGVWGGKVARPPGEAVVAGALARAHALERHPGSSGGVPCRQSTNMGLQAAAQALLVGEAAPPGGGGPALEGLAPPPIATRVGSCGPSPLPSRLCQVWTGRREGGGPGWGPGAGAQFHLAPRLSPWEKPTSSAPCPPNSCSAVPRGPRSKCPWGQGWASLRPFPARVGVVRHQFPGWQDAGHTPGDLWVASHPSPAAPHTESPFRQERSAELRLLTVCSRPPQEQSMVLLAPQGESVSRAGVSR